MQRSKGGTQKRGVKMKPVLPALKRPPERGATDKPFAGKVFYLDIPSKIITEKLEKDIKDLGGTVEGFLSKEISCLITSKKEARSAKSLPYSCSLSSPEPAQNPGSSSALPGSRQGGIPERNANKKPEQDQASRGKSLLKKVITGQEILPKNSILANAWNWGVRILHVNEARIYIEQKKGLLQQAKQPEPAAAAVLKLPMRRKPRACRLKRPYLKVEDNSCKYKPLYLVAPYFHSFQPLPPTKMYLSIQKATAEKKAKLAKQGLNYRQCIRKEQKKRGYCECCLKKYNDIDVHLVSQQHRTFSQGPNYQAVDDIIAMFDFDFVDWSVYRQETRSSTLMPTVANQPEEKEIADNRVSQQISSFVKRTPGPVQRTELEVPLADVEGILYNIIRSPEPINAVLSPIQTEGNNVSITDSFFIPSGTPATISSTDHSSSPAGEAVTVCDEARQQNGSHSPIRTPQKLTLGLSVATVPRNGSPIKKLKLDGPLISGTAYSEPVDADHVTSSEPVMEAVPDCLETTGLSNHSDGLRDHSPHRSPSRLHRKVKSVRKARKQEDLSAPPPVCKVSVPVEEYELSSSRERLLSLFETSEAPSEFRGFSCKSESLPRGTDIKEEQLSSKEDFRWCLFAATSSSETFHGF